MSYVALKITCLPLPLFMSIRVLILLPVLVVLMSCCCGAQVHNAPLHHPEGGKAGGKSGGGRGGGKKR